MNPLNEKQAKVKSTFYRQHQMLLGSAGTGKTYVALSLALELVKKKTYDRIVIVRSAVPTREVGFLPGTLEEKNAEYEAPYRSIVNDVSKMSKVEKELHGDAYNKYKNLGQIVFTSTSYLRGLTFDNAIVIFDELQSATFHELDTVITRLGNESKLVLVGDLKQCDLKKGQSGLSEFMNIIKNMESKFNIVEFAPDDIVRGGLVKDYIITKEAYFLPLEPCPRLPRTVFDKSSSESTTSIFE